MNDNRFRSSTPLSAQTIRRPVDERAERPAPRAFLLEVRTEWTCRARRSSPPEHRARSPHEQLGHDWNARPPGREGDSLRASSCSSNGFGANTRPTQTMDGYDGCAGSALSSAQHPEPRPGRPPRRPDPRAAEARLTARAPQRIRGPASRATTPVEPLGVRPQSSITTAMTIGPPSVWPSPPEPSASDYSHCSWGLGPRDCPRLHPAGTGRKLGCS